jgi:predicted aconitase
VTLRLDAEERAMLAGAVSPAAALAMRLVVRLAEAGHARRLLPIESAHIDSCLYHGQAGLDFARKLVDGGGHVRVPATLNVSSLDLLHPDLYRGSPETAAAARSLMEAYEMMGCRPTWTCAPYQLIDRPLFGEHIAWAESNAIVFANSVLGARTDRYGDFIDICAAITGRVPAAGLHLDAGRRARLVLDAGGLTGATRRASWFPAVLGHLLGRAAGTSVAAVVGLEAMSEDGMKALGAAAASSGGVAMFHLVGITPEAPTLESATGGAAVDHLAVTEEMIRRARADLTTASGERVDAVSVGTPHFSVGEFKELARLLAGRSAVIPLYVNTGRDVLVEVMGTPWWDDLASVRIVTDTCTYITPILEEGVEVVMTDSAKWAYYAPGNLGVSVVFGSLAECVESAVTGRMIRHE